MEKRYYIAYGSNLNVPQMRARCPHATILETADLRGRELLFKGSKTGFYLTIEESEGGSVPVVIWEVDDSDESALDRYEGYPKFYYKKEIRLLHKDIRTGRLMGPPENRRFVEERRSSKASELLSPRKGEQYGTCDDEVTAFAYIMHEERPIGIPTGFYMRTCLDGYDTFRFDRNVLIGAYEKCERMCGHEG